MEFIETMNTLETLKMKNALKAAASTAAGIIVLVAGAAIAGLGLTVIAVLAMFALAAFGLALLASPFVRMLGADASEPVFNEPGANSSLS